MNHQPGPSSGGNNNTTLQTIVSEGTLASHGHPVREEIKKYITARDGTYRSVDKALLTRPKPLPHYAMPAGMSSMTTGQVLSGGAPVRVSFLNCKPPERPQNFSVAGPSTSTAPNQDELNSDTPSDLISFNVGKELYVFNYRGIQTETDLSRPIDKRVYKGTAPTFHSFNPHTYTAKSCQLLIGFSLGQIQIVDPLENCIPSPINRLFNEDRYVDKTAVTCIRWHPSNGNIFVVSHSSGNLYVYDYVIQGPPQTGQVTHPTVWQVDKKGDNYALYSWKVKSPQRNPLRRLQINDGSYQIHQFEFSPDGTRIAIVSQDGFLRVFDYQDWTIVAVMKSFFGGLTCLSWSPDAQLIATGGEDDLLTVFSVTEKRVICRGQAHKSWISQVQFDPYAPFLHSSESRKMTSATSCDSSTYRFTASGSNQEPCTSTQTDPHGGVLEIEGLAAEDKVMYRIGSVGQDTCLCFWDITSYMLNETQSDPQRASTSAPTNANSEAANLAEESQVIEQRPSTPATTQQPEKKKKNLFSKIGFGGKKRHGSGGNSSSPSQKANQNQDPAAVERRPDEPTPIYGSPACPALKTVRIIEPVMCKKVAQDRLTMLEFRPDCVVTACQEGYICTWARPSPDDPHRGSGIKTPTDETPESEQKPPISATTSSFGYASDGSNGVARSESLYSSS